MAKRRKVKPDTEVLAPPADTNEVIVAPPADIDPVVEAPVVRKQKAKAFLNSVSRGIALMSVPVSFKVKEGKTVYINGKESLVQNVSKHPVSSAVDSRFVMIVWPQDIPVRRKYYTIER